MRYVEYREYFDLGGVCEETAFNRHIDRACGIIRNATFGRVDDMNIVPNQVKAACRDLVEFLARQTTAEATVVSRSQTVGSISQSESYSDKKAEDLEMEIQNILYDYLAAEKDDNGTPLLYRGCGS